MIKRHRALRPILLAGLSAWLLFWLARPAVALAHPLDVYLQATYLTLSPEQVVVELDLSPGVLVAPQALAELDANGDAQISDAEGRAYAALVLSSLTVQVDGQPVKLSITRIDMPAYLTIQAGYGTIRVFTQSAWVSSQTGTHAIYYRNDYAPTGSAYQVNAFVENGAAITLGKQNRDELQQSLSLDYAVGGAAVDSAGPAAVGGTSQAQQLLAYLYAPALSPWVLTLALGLATVLGGLHALTPGHGKTLVAAYLVGSRGTVGHAAALGAIVTFTHTASVIVVGLLALFASQFVVPSALVPILEVGSGLLVVGLGARLVWQRWAALRRPASGVRHDHEHGHSHEHGHGHTHASEQPHTHDHGDGHVHAHAPGPEGIRLGSLVAMGVSGGLLPCPEALGIMVIAVGLNRILLGLGLIVSFSFGLAAVLIVIGILLVRSRSLVDRLGGVGSRWTTWLPLASAVIVTVLGASMAFGGLAAYLKAI